MITYRDFTLMEVFREAFGHKYFLIYSEDLYSMISKMRYLSNEGIMGYRESFSSYGEELILDDIDDVEIALGRFYNIQVHLPRTKKEIIS